MGSRAATAASGREHAGRRPAPAIVYRRRPSGEYAARAGESHAYAGRRKQDEVAWFDTNANGTTHPVGLKKPNAWGLYDMSGNVWEWVWDWHDDYPGDSELVDYEGHSEISYRVERGGSWWAAEGAARVSNRGDSTPGFGRPT